ncbi:hypothetical protein ES705_20069 [subsurface metagenome]
MFSSAYNILVEPLRATVMSQNIPDDIPHDIPLGSEGQHWTSPLTEDR